MVFPPMDLNIIATVIAAVFGGAGLKIIEKFLSKENEATQQATAMRNELRKQVSGLKSDINLLKKENQALAHDLDTWQEKYWELKSRNVILQGQIDTLTRQLEEYITISSETPTSPTGGTEK